MASFSLSSTTGLYAYETIEHLADDLLATSGQERSHALFVVDHDTLDDINLRFGREAGDAVITHTTRVLPAVFRATDLVARTHGDEFVVLMKDVSCLDAIECIAGLILQLLRCPCGTREDPVEATVTVGIAMSRGQTPRTFGELYDNACSALAEAKRAALHRFVIYDHEGKRACGTFGFDRLVSASTPNLQPFLDTIKNGGVLLRSKTGKRFRPQYFSDSFLALLGGMAREEALRIFGDDVIRGIHPDDQQRIRDELAEAFATNAPLITIARIRAVGGSYLWVSINMTWTRDGSGRIDAYASHVSVESLVENYDYAVTGMPQPASTGTTLYMFAVPFSDGVPAAPLLFDDEGKRFNGFDDATLSEALLQSGVIHRDSERTLREFCRGIEEGKKSGGMLTLCTSAKDGVLHWARISYLMTYDEDGRPLRASGSIRELPHVASALGRFFREEKLYESVGPQLLRAARVDLTAGVVEEVHPRGFETLHGASYEEFVTAMTAKYCYADDAALVARMMSRDSAMRAVDEGLFQTSCEFRREDGGRIRWTSIVVHLAENPANHHMTAFVYIADIERRHVEVAFASTFAKPDKRTGLYSRDALERIAGALQYADVSDNPLSALAVIRVAMPADLRAMLSAGDAASGQVYLGQQLAVCLAQEGLVARYGADGILVLVPRVDSESWLRHRLRYALSDLRKAYVDKDGKPHPIVLACGYSVEQIRSLHFKDAAARAKDACRASDAEPTGSLRSFEERMILLCKEMEPGDGRSMRTIPFEDVKRPLTGIEREALDDAMRAMIVAGTFDEAAANTLAILGQAYKAHRVFTVALLENGTISGLHEWREVGAQPIIGQLVGRSLSEYAALQSSAESNLPVLLERIHSPQQGLEAMPSKTWRFVTFPILKYGLCVGFLCIEDPLVNGFELALVNEVVPLLVHLRDKDGSAVSSSAPRTRDLLTGLPNKLAFERDAVTFDATMFHSVGVVRLGLERLYTLEGDRDTAGEDQMLLYAARNLSGLFPLDAVYLSDELQLTCICTNMSYDAFNARTTRMAAIMRQRTRSGFALCDAWSDAMPSLAKLLDEAATSVYGDRSILFPDERPAPAGTAPVLRRAFDGDAFSIRLQPQVDLASGKVVGSEALVRCQTPAGETIMPSEFVPRMEADGDISDLDYFVFEKALSTLAAWKDRGLDPVPVAVNFSRKTVSDTSFIASVLAIASRYDVPESLLEIEITESLGAFKNVELRSAMDTLRGQGFRFALDDLGSEYSTLSAMSDLPFDTVKLDRLLVKRFVDDSVSRSIVEGVAHACQKNGIRCVAEGVEQPSYIEPLVSMGCQYGQGYLFARPMTVEQFTDEYLVHRRDGAHPFAVDASRAD